MPYNLRRPYPNELYHHGIKGQKWGVRRFQNENGSLTTAGKKRYSTGDYNAYRREHLRTTKNKIEDEEERYRKADEYAKRKMDIQSQYGMNRREMKKYDAIKDKKASPGEIGIYAEGLGGHRKSTYTTYQNVGDYKGLSRKDAKNLARSEKGRNVIATKEYRKTLRSSDFKESVKEAKRGARNKNERVKAVDEQRLEAARKATNKAKDAKVIDAIKASRTPFAKRKVVNKGRPLSEIRLDKIEKDYYKNKRARINAAKFVAGAAAVTLTAGVIAVGKRNFERKYGIKIHGPVYAYNKYKNMDPGKKRKIANVIKTYQSIRRR